MGLQAGIRHVDVLSTDVVGTTYTVDDLGFDPNFLIVSTGGSNATVDTTGGGNARKGFGVAVSTTSRWALSATSVDANATADCGSRQNVAACAIANAVSGIGAAQGALDLDAFVAGGFRLIVDIQFSFSVRVNVIAIGGLVDASTGEGTEPATATTQTIAHGLGGVPDAVIFCSIGATTSGTIGMPDSGMSTGWGTATHNCVIAGGSNDGPTNMQTIRYGLVGECLAHFDAGMTATTGRASLTALDATNITLTWNEVNGAANRRFQWCAVRGGQWHSGDILTQTDTTTPITESGFGFIPVVGLTLSHNTAASTTDIVQDHDSRSYGAFTSVSSRMARSIWDEDAVATSETARGVEFDECYLRISATDTIAGLMDVTDLGYGHVDFIMDDADPDAALVGVLFAGNPLDWTIDSEGMIGRVMV